MIQRVKSNIEFEIIYCKICRFVQHGDLCFRNACECESINYKTFQYVRKYILNKTSSNIIELFGKNYIISYLRTYPNAFVCVQQIHRNICTYINQNASPYLKVFVRYVNLGNYR